MTDKEIDRIIKANIQMAGFVLLVEKMRNAQKGFNNVRFVNKSSEAYKEAKKNRTRLESEVDEWLKKLK